MLMGAMFIPMTFPQAFPLSSETVRDACIPSGLVGVVAGVAVVFVALPPTPTATL
jgi:hypothetical protein